MNARTTDTNDGPFTRTSSGLVKGLSWFDIFIMTVSAPAGSGILYYAVNSQTEHPGGNVAIAFCIGLLMFLPVCFLVVNMAAGMPRAGCLYVGISRVIGPQIAYIAAMLFFVGQSMIAGVLGHLIMSVSGGVIAATGSAAGLPTLVSVGTFCGTKVGTIGGGFLWVLFFWAVTLRGMVLFRKVMRLFFVLPLLATLAIIILFAAIDPTNAASAFDTTWGSGMSATILSTARSYGWHHVDFSLAATIGLLLVVLWAYNGFEMASYAASEIQKDEKRIHWGFFGGWFTVGMLYIILALVVFWTFGDFIAAYDFMFRNHSDVLKTMMPEAAPSIPFYTVSIAPSVWIGLPLAIAVVLWFANCIPPIFLSTSRLAFALAKDQSVPASLERVHVVTGAPTWATHLTALFALVGVVFQTFEVNVVLGTLGFCTFFSFWLYGYAAMLIPSRMPDVFAKMPYRRTLLSVPLLSWAGLFTFAFGWFAILFTARQITLEVAGVLTGVITIGGLVYLIQNRRCRAKRADLDAIFSDLPED